MHNPLFNYFLHVGILADTIREPIERTVGRVNEHYLDSSRVIKRAFGDTVEDDFQKYNWGMSIIPEMGLEGDKLDFLTSLYCRTIPKRIVEIDFKVIVLYHTSFKFIENRREKKEKWADLKASWRIQKYRKPGFPDSISHRNMKSIMKVNELSYDLDIVRITKDMRTYDQKASKLHMLLLEDPLITRGRRKKIEEKNAEIESYASQVAKFEAMLATEEEEYTAVRVAEIERRMKEKLENDQLEIQERLRKRRLKEEERLRFVQEEKERALRRLDEIRKEREEAEAMKVEEAQKRSEAAHPVEMDWPVDQLSGESDNVREGTYSFT